MVMLKKRFTRYEPYASATITDIFTEEELKDVSLLKANHFEHTLFLNKEGISFEMQKLPNETQISIINDAVILDLDKDGKQDIITGGNFYGTDAEFGRYDASIGSVLLNKGLNFETVPASKSGLKIPGNVQHIKRITINGEKHLLIVRNNEASSLLRLK
jgi:hypothetical protein